MAGENDLERENLTHRNSHITANDTLTVVSGNDTSISGANLLANDLDITVGNNLHVESRQDTGSVEGKRWDASGSITVGAGVSGGANVGYGETEGSRAWVTEQTSLIGTESVNIQVGNHTHVDGALIAHINDQGEDGGHLSLDTRTLSFSDLQDHDQEDSNYLSIGFSTGGSSGANANTGANPDSEGSSWTVAGTHYELDREQTNRATIGQGSIRVREDANTGNDSTDGLNRDIDMAQEITKDKERDIDVYASSTATESVENLAASGGQNTLKQWQDNVASVADPQAWKTIADNARQTASTDALSQSIKSLQYTVQSLGTNLDQSLEQALGATGERMISTLMRYGLSEEQSNQLLRDNPQLVSVGTQLQVVQNALDNPQAFALEQQGEQLHKALDANLAQKARNQLSTDDLTYTVIGVAPSPTPLEAAGMALGDGKLYIDQLRESHPTTARLAEIALSGALGGGLKSLIMVPARQGLDAAVNEFAGEQIQNATDFVTNHAGRLITKDDETYGEFAELADGGSYQNRQGRVKAGSEFILGTVLGVIGTGKGGESGTAVGVKGNSNSGHTSNNSTGNQPEGATVQDSSGNSVAEKASGPDFVVTKDGATVPVSQSQMRKGFDDAGYPSSTSKITDEAAVTHTIQTPKGPIDVRTMEGGANHPRRAVLSTPGQPRSPRTPSGGTPQGTKQERRAASHFEQSP